MLDSRAPYLVRPPLPRKPSSTLTNTQQVTYIGNVIGRAHRLAPHSDRVCLDAGTFIFQHIHLHLQRLGFVLLVVFKCRLQSLPTVSRRGACRQHVLPSLSLSSRLRRSFGKRASLGWGRWWGCVDLLFPQLCPCGRGRFGWVGGFGGVTVSRWECCSRYAQVT